MKKASEFVINLRMAQRRAAQTYWLRRRTPAYYFKKWKFNGFENRN